jgi:Zn-dependent protease
LVHAEKLEDLSRRAKAAWRLGHFAEERSLWLESLALLPDDTVQHRSIADRVTEIDGMLAGAEDQPHGDWKKKATMGIGPLAVLLLAKGKFLLLGLTKLTTLISMFAALGVYWAMYGWALAAGIIISIYIHEMGHVARIRHYGLPASAPMFIPGLGAFIQLKTANLPPVPDSRIGLAGPIYGLGAAVAALGAYYVTGVRVWGVIANFGAWVNLFNLIPVWFLDGSRGMRSFTRWQRSAVLIVAAAIGILAGNKMMFLIALCAGYRLFTRDWQDEPDQTGMLQYLGLLVALALVMALSAPAP